MNLRERFFKFTDAPFTWTRAVLVGSAIWIFAIITMGQIPSLIIYKFDQYIAEIIEFTQKIPGVNEAGLNTQQIKIIRDIVNNGFQISKRVLGSTVADVLESKGITVGQRDVFAEQDGGQR